MYVFAGADICWRDQISAQISADICSSTISHHASRYLVMLSEISSRLMLRCRRTLFHRPPLLLHDGGGRGWGNVNHGSPYFSCGQKNPISVASRPSSPPPPFNPNNTPPSARAPLPPTFIRRRVMHVLPGEGWGGGQRRCEGAEERDTMATTRTTMTTTTLPLPQTERTTSACAVEPRKTTTINL